MKRNPLSSISYLVILLVLVSVPFRSNAQLVINEVSQGASGSKEYVELLVTGTPSCSGILTVDLRGWYIDDNNGTFATGSGTGIATGCIRFSQDPLWSAVPIGQLIVIYNDADINASIPAQDLSLTDGNCHLIIPISNCTLLEKNTSQPTIGNAVYPTSGFTACGSWSPVSMANGDDSFQTVDPPGNRVHSVSWGNNSTNTIIYFSGTSAGMVAWMNNASDNNPANQANWTRTAVAGNETPGDPNNTANALWIASMNYNCTPFSPLSATASATNTCGCSGTATANATGGTGNYSYSWAPSGGTNATATGLCPGTYTCTVTDLAGCTQIVTATVAGLAAPTATLQSSTNVSCPGGSDGSATVNPSGGSGTYTYSWAPSGGTGITANNLSAGTYTCTITDSNGCSVTQQVTITEPQALSVALTAPFVVCANSSINITGVLTGNAGNVSWSGGTGTFSPANSVNTTYTVGSGDVGSITLTVTVTNAACSEIVTDAVSFNINPLPVAAISGPSSFCAGDSITLTASGGTSYLWSTGATSSSIVVQTAGTYSVVATNSCGNDTTSVTVTTTNAPVVNITANGPTSFCAGDSVTLNASGGSSYAWSNGATSSFITVNTAGTYSVIASGSCGTDSASINVTVLPQPNAQITANGPTTFCAGDSVTLTASGGTNYLWSTGASTASITVNTSGTYSVAVTNSCGTDTSNISVSTSSAPVAQITAGGPTSICPGDTVVLTASGGTVFNWSTGATTASITVNATGTYSVAVTGNCGTDTAVITITSNPLPVAQITAGGPTTFCVGGNVVLTASGGNSYTWSTSATTAAITVNTAGTYTVTTANGCGTDTATITISTLPLPVAQITANGPLSFCVGGNVTLTASGGTSYLWSNNSTSASITVNTAGTYTVTATNSCGSDATTVTVTTVNPPVATLTANGPLSFCAGNNVTLTAGGGGNYLWSTGATNPSITVNTSGTFIVSVTNTCGTDTASITTNVQPLPVATISGNTVICPNATNVLTAGGGGTYLWSNGSTANSITVSNGGTYYLVATNACGSDTASINVTVDQVTADFSASVYSGQAPLPVDFTDNSSSNVTGWSWSFGDGGTTSVTDPSYTYTSGGYYPVILTVSDAFGCTDTAMAWINITDIPSALTVPNVFTPNGDGTNDYFIVANEGIKEYRIEIYDRWGVRVYESNDPSGYWNGKSSSGSDVVDGTYYYVINATGFDRKEYQLTGFLTLIRSPKQ